jgi:pimeloyl-ACP methyl ester carboxylesterase
MNECPAKTIEHALLALRDRPDQTALLPSIAMPTLIVVGEQDAITPKAVAESMNKAIPRSKLAVIPGSGHLSPMEKPDDVNRAIRNFLAASLPR